MKLYSKIKLISEEIKIDDSTRIKGYIKPLMIKHGLIGIVSSVDISLGDKSATCKISYKLVCCETGESETVQSMFVGGKNAESDMLISMCERLALKSLFMPISTFDETDYRRPVEDYANTRGTLQPFNSARPDAYIKAQQRFVNLGSKISKSYEALMLPFSLDEWSVFHDRKQLNNKILAPMLAAYTTGELREYMRLNYPNFPYYDWDRKHHLFDRFVYDSPVGEIRSTIPTHSERLQHKQVMDKVMLYLFRKEGLGFDKSKFNEFVEGKGKLKEFDLTPHTVGGRFQLRDFLMCATAATISKLCEEYRTLVEAN